MEPLSLLTKKRSRSDPRSSGIVVMAEMANAHEGDPDTAKAIIDAAARAGADAIKFHVFTPSELAVPTFPHYQVYERVQMSSESWQELVEYTHRQHLDVFADVFGLGSAALMHSLSVDGFKINAADVPNVELLRCVAASGRPVLLSVGGSTWLETAEALAELRSAGAPLVVLMHGVQSYPTALIDSSLRRIELLRQKFGVPVGFASHVDGGSPEAVTLPIWAAAAGADVLEVHMTLDRAKQGLDYYSSLEPARFAEVVDVLRAMEPALGERSLQLSSQDVEYRLGHKKWLVATQDIKPGETLTRDNSALKRVNGPPPGRPLDPEMALGRRVLNPVAADAPVRLKDVQYKVAATLPCRAESTRLYGKPMQLVGDRPILQHLIDRLRLVSSIDEIVLAISEGPSSGLFVDYATRQGLSFVIGPEQDVLGRLIQAAEHVQADLIVRVTSENPFIYWENLNELIHRHVERHADLTVTEKLPLGTFAEIVSLDALKRAHRYGEDRHRSECSTLFIAEHPELFTIQRILPPQPLQRPEIRLTVDTPHDLLLVRTLWDALHRDGHVMTVQEIVEFLDAHPDLAAVNAGEHTRYLWK